MALIGRIRGSDHRPGCLDWSGRVGRSHCMSHSWSLLDTVTGCGGMGVGWGRLGTEEVERERETTSLNFREVSTQVFTVGKSGMSPC